MSTRGTSIRVIGSGVFGLWQAVVLAREGHEVELIERSDERAPFANAASRFAGAMLAPDCEAEVAPPLVRDLGRGSIALWKAVYPCLIERGSLVVATARDRAELARFASVTENFERLDRARLEDLEPALADTFEGALYFPDEAHMPVMDALDALLISAREAGVKIRFGVDGTSAPGIFDVLIDTRGYAAASHIPQLRGVRGERAIVRAREVTLSRPVRLLHPRIPLYIVPWRNDEYLVGATVIESDEGGPMTVRSGIELLGAATAVHPGFAEAEILDLGAGVRPAFADNIPRALVSADGRTIRVNGAYRHGFLLGPIMAETVAGYLRDGAEHPLLSRE